MARPLLVYVRERRQVMVNIFLVYGIEILTGLDILLGLQGIEGMESFPCVFEGLRGQW